MASAAATGPATPKVTARGAAALPDADGDAEPEAAAVPVAEVDAEVVVAATAAMLMMCSVSYQVRCDRELLTSRLGHLKVLRLSHDTLVVRLGAEKVDLVVIADWGDKV